MRKSKKIPKIDVIDVKVILHSVDFKLQQYTSESSVFIIVDCLGQMEHVPKDVKKDVIPGFIKQYLYTSIYKYKSVRDIGQGFCYVYMN